MVAVSISIHVSAHNRILQTFLHISDVTFHWPKSFGVPFPQSNSALNCKFTPSRILVAMAFDWKKNPLFFKWRSPLIITFYPLFWYVWRASFQLFTFLLHCTYMYFKNILFSFNVENNYWKIVCCEKVDKFLAMIHTAIKTLVTLSLICVYIHTECLYTTDVHCKVSISCVAWFRVSQSTYIWWHKSLY